MYIQHSFNYSHSQPAITTDGQIPAPAPNPGGRVYFGLSGGSYVTGQWPLTGGDPQGHRKRPCPGFSGGIVGQEGVEPAGGFARCEDEGDGGVGVRSSGTAFAF